MIFSPFHYFETGCAYCLAEELHRTLHEKLLTSGA